MGLLRRSIRIKLLLGNGLLLLLLLATSMVAGYSAATSISSFRQLATNNLAGAVQLANAQDALWQLRYGFPQFLVLGDADRQRIIAEQDQWYRQIDENLAAYGAGSRTSEEQQVLAKWNEVYTNYRGARPRWFELQLAGKVEEAAAWRAQTTTPYGRDAVAALEQLINLQREIATQQEASALAEALTLRLVFFILIGLAFVIGLVVTVAVSRSVARPIAALTATARAITQGDLAAVAPVTSQDELGVLGAAFNQMTATLRQQTQQLEQQVAERTSALQTALAEAEARAAEQAKLLEENAQQYATIQGLSAPIIPVLPGVVIAPLIGLMNSERAEVFSNTVLAAIEQQHVRHVVFDITGVPMVDSHVAQVLVQTARAVRLLGAQIALVGIRPEVAQTIITLQLDLSVMTPYATMQQAIDALLALGEQRAGSQGTGRTAAFSH
jgi:anti-anti-sigma factor